MLTRQSSPHRCTCAGNPPNYFSGVCQQDSGGPLFLPSTKRSRPDVLYGVVSNGNGKCLGAPGAGGSLRAPLGACCHAAVSMSACAQARAGCATCVGRQPGVYALIPVVPAPSEPPLLAGRPHLRACTPPRAAQTHSPALPWSGRGLTGRPSSCWQGAGRATVSQAPRVSPWVGGDKVLASAPQSPATPVAP